MTPSQGNSGFLAYGGDSYADALSKDEAERLASLKAELRATKDPQRRAELKQQIADIKRQYRQKRTDAAYCLYRQCGG